MLAAGHAAPAAAKSNTDLRTELECLALTIYFEARGEPDDGKLAVGHVVMNRAAHPRFPDEVCDVVRQGEELPLLRCQFTWWCDGRSDEPTELAVWNKIRALAQRIYWRSVPDPTAGALWYHADWVAPSWRRQLRRGRQIGQHIFYHPSDAPDPARRQVAQRTPRAEPAGKAGRDQGPALDPESTFLLALQPLAE